MFSFQITASVSATVLLMISFYFVHEWTKDNHKFRLPPGPHPVPFLGNIHQLPSSFHQRTFAEWGIKYGDIVYARLFRTPALVINSVQAAQDLMEKRSSKFSDRPRFILLAELMGWDCVITHLKYGDRFRKHRKWIQNAFQEKTSLASYRPVQRRETYVLLSGLAETPSALMSHLRRFTAAMIVEIAYGHSIISLDDELIRLAEQATKETVESGSAGSMLVDFFPACKQDFIHGNENRTLKKILIVKMLDTPFEMVKDAMASGTASPSFTASLLEETWNSGKLTEEDEDDIKGAAGVLYGAATDTTGAVLATFILAMVLHPEVYKRAQEEIDRVIGSERLPDFDDREALPYLECVIKEVLRWNCPVPLGLPHRVISNDEYRGYDIPSGSMIIANLWAMTQNEQFYSEPETFCPERFLDMDSETASMSDPRNVVFGFGRRICPGQQFADSSVWLVAANIIATMNICKAQDGSGAEITPMASFIPGFVSHPRDFPCDIRPRSKKVLTTLAGLRAIYNP
ncbi:hypothetical protein AcV7_010042 [Taiwanofungus camphoratus]|nr:hypothetical protein AcV7_010042 [Antrodia cinnamomea]